MEEGYWWVLEEKSTSLERKCVKKGVDQHTEYTIINPPFLGRQVPGLHLRYVFVFSWGGGGRER